MKHYFLLCSLLSLVFACGTEREKREKETIYDYPDACECKKSACKESCPKEPSCHPVPVPTPERHRVVYVNRNTNINTNINNNSSIDANVVFEGKEYKCWKKNKHRCTPTHGGTCPRTEGLPMVEDEYLEVYMGDSEGILQCVERQQP